MTTNLRRSSAAQLGAMERQWPSFKGRKLPDGTLLWYGTLKPKSQTYGILVYWKPSTTVMPFVIIDTPKISPREGAAFVDIPHLIFNANKPEDSALCLFDPDGNEWTPADLIAETTICWTAEWLLYYELWHITGEWLGSGIGFESVAQMRLAEARFARPVVNDFL